MHFTIQRVSIEDFDKVVSIRDDVYDGTDYIPGTFKELVNHPAYQGYAVVVDGQYVSFMFIVYVDDGKTAVIRAARVRQEYEGKGLYKLFKEKVKQLRPNSIFRYATIVEDTHQSTARRINNGLVKLIMERELAYYKKHSGSSLHDCSLPFNLRIEKSRYMTSEDLKKIFESPIVLKTIFPEKRIVCEFIPFRTVISNIHLIMFHAPLAN